MPLPVVIEIVNRRTVKGSITGFVEIEEYFLLFMSFFTLAAVHFEGGHWRIDLLYSRFPKWIQNVLGSATSLLSFLLFTLMCSVLIRMGIENFQSHELSWGLHLPLWIFRFAAALGALLMSGATLQKFLLFLKDSIDDRRLRWLIVALSAACLIFIIPVAGLLPTGMSPTITGLAGMGLLFLLIFLGMHIGFAMGFTGFLGMTVMYQGPLPALANLGLSAYSFASNYQFTVLPLFMLIGQLAYHSGISKNIFHTASTWMGRLPGGLNIATIGGCAGFSAVAGDSLSTAVTMGTIAAPEMRKRKYSMRLGAACMAAGGTLGILIPPSVGFIVYAIVTETSIGQLFIAGIIPGIILTALFMLIIYIKGRTNPEAMPPGDPTTFKEKLLSLKGIIGALALFIIIIGGILTGIFSPIEAGSIGVVALLFPLITRRLRLKSLIDALENTMKMIGGMMILFIGVGALGYFIAATRLPFALADFVTGLEFNRYLVFSAVILLFIFGGCVINVVGLLLLMLPTIFPAVVALGFDPIWFGVICVITMEMGVITPPIGINVFAIASVIPDVPMEEIFKGIVPFFFCMVICIILITIFPQIALYLPGLLF